MAEARGFIFKDSGDRPTQHGGSRVVDATRSEAIERLASELRDRGSGRYDLTVSTEQVAPDHIRATLTWWNSCE
jgi:hypothetical protein